MTIQLNHDKTTDVAYIDVAEMASKARVRVIDVSEHVGLRCQVLARVDAETGEFFGLIIEDYSKFRREVMKKYVAFQVEKIIDLIVSKVKESLNSETGLALSHA
jgi:hypothetical protein